jgi:hypothetical protein
MPIIGSWKQINIMWLWNIQEYTSTTTKIGEQIQIKEWRILEV